MGRKGTGVEVRDNSIRIKFVLNGVTQRKTIYIDGKPAKPTPANRKYATKLSAAIRDKIRVGAFSMAEYFPDTLDTGNGALTVKGQLATWINAQRVTSSTRKGYMTGVRFWNAKIGEQSIKSIKRSDILTILAARDDLSNKTINNYVSVIRGAFELAEGDNLIDKSPVRDMPTWKWQKPLVDPFTLEEAEAIIADMAKHYHKQVAQYTAFKFFSGLRTGESFGLRWPSVDLRSNHIVISESIVVGERTDKTKTSAVRKVLLNSRALQAIKDQRQHTFMQGEYVFNDPRAAVYWADPDADKHWQREAQFRYFWVPTLKRLGIRHRRPYNTRHTYATMMLMAGMTPAFCALQMGHSVKVFLETYAKWIPGAGDATEMAKLEAKISNSSLESPQEFARGLKS